MKNKGYIKQLEFNQYNRFNQYYLNVKYTRNGEFNNITFKINKPFKNEKEVRNFINN